MKKSYFILKGITDYHKDFRLKEKTKCFKICSKCKEIKLISKFPADRRSLDGLSGICKNCQNKYSQGRYVRNKEKILALNKKYREEHKEAYQKYIRKYREDHREYFKNLSREFYLKNREAIIERNNKYYQDHKEICQARKKLWRIKNKERIGEYNKKYKLEHKKISQGYPEGIKSR